MTNEISNMSLLKANRPGVESGRFNESASSKRVEVTGADLPAPGNNLPQRVEQKPQPEFLTEVNDALNEINKVVQTVQRDLAFSLDDASGKTVIKVIDSESGQLVRQIPSEEVLALATYLKTAREDGIEAADISKGMLFSDIT